jgi:hypothetical protein
LSIAEFRAAQAELAAAFAARRPPVFGEVGLGVWARAADDLVEQGELEAARVAVGHLQRAWPDFAWATNLARLLDITPLAHPDEPPFRDRGTAPFQVIPRPGADTVVVVFCGYNHMVGMPPRILHRWLSCWPVSLIYLRDPKSQAYLGGIEPLGQDLGATVAGLRREISALGARRVVCYGPSIGGYGALRYGLELGADAVVCMGGIVNLTPGFNVGLNHRERIDQAQALFPDEPLDLRHLHQAAAQPPQTFMVYAEHNWDDRLHAEHMAGLRDVALIQIDGARSHHAAMELMRSGGFKRVMDQALGANGAASRPGEGPT